MKIAFFGTWEFSRNILEWILTYEDIEVNLVVSQPDKPVWRKKIMTPTPLKVLAEENNIPVLQPEKLKNNQEFFDELNKWNFDFIIVVAYGKIVPKEVLEASKYGAINLHGSILPDYRWASPIQESLKNWDTETWLTIMYMSEAMDEWDILSIGKITVDIMDKTPDIFEAFEEFWPELLINTLNWVLSWEIVWQKQDDSKASYCSKIEKQDWLINFNNSAVSIYNQYRAYSPWPWIYSSYEDKKISIEECFFDEDTLEFDEDFSVWDVVELEENWNKQIWILCWSGILILKQVKLEWKKSMNILDFINGNKDFLDYNFA